VRRFGWNEIKYKIFMIATSPQTESAESSKRQHFAPSSTSPNSLAQPTIRRSVRDDGICILTFDRPASSANIFDRRALTELGEELDAIASDSKIKGLVLTSAKRSIFIAGADIKAMSENASPDDIGKLVELGQDVMNRLAALPFPTAAAIHGAAVGGGYELCLACDYRVASTDKATKIGLPETQLGILPAWGGSTRLPRLIGLPKALDIILAGKTLAAKAALKRGMVDQLAHKEYVIDAAIRILRRGKRTANGHVLTNNALVAKTIALRVRAQLLKKTRGHYSAVLEALEVVTSGISKSIADSLALERESIIRLVQGETCRNLIRIFLLQERAKKQIIPWVGPVTELKSIKRTAVIGAGVMGAGIAQWLSSRQLPVILRDINTEQVAKGMAAIAKTYKEGAKRHVFTSLEVRNGLDRIYPAPAEASLRNVDLVIEAAVEKLELKKKIFQSLDKLAGEETILATNTSALPISELAASTHRPERVLGLHFFNPVHRMQLVEIVAARQTSPEVLQRALSFVQQIGKLPVVVKDSPGFVVNRILMPYLIEAGNLFESGATIAELDEAMLDFGMPMGPMRLLDEVGIDVALHVAQTIAANYGDRMRVPEILSKMAQAGLLGKKVGRGFYLHAKGKNPIPYPVVAGLLSGNPQHATRISDLQERMVLLMVNEAARCLEEEIVPDPADVDFAMIMGTGFAPFRGGPLRYADSIGIMSLVDSMNRLADSGATHFVPCGLLRDLAAIKKNFYKS
jgi:3-hydroxyacyl-CoA dehydrogenase/enoyl-CoA hydratase/3-hydroxybutyryl-CoA epimerase